MKKVLALILSLACVLTVIGIMPVSAASSVSKWDGKVPSADLKYKFSGSGTEKDPYLIKSAKELAILAANTRSGKSTYDGVYFKLTTDIDMAGKKWYGIGGCTEGAGIDPSMKVYFGGIFDGDYHVIKNLQLADKNEAGNTIYMNGLFGQILNAEIRNLGIGKTTIKVDGTSRIGALVGASTRGFIVENCYSLANIEATASARTSAHFGAFFGVALDAASFEDRVTEKRIENCYNTGNITVKVLSMFRIGGLIGCSTGSTTYINCYNSGDVSITGLDFEGEAPAKGNRALGGICGAAMDSPVIMNCHQNGAVKYTGILGPDEDAMAGGVLFGVVGGAAVASKNDMYIKKGTNIDYGVYNVQSAKWYTEVDNPVNPITGELGFIVEPEKQVTDAETTKTDETTVSIDTAAEDTTVDDETVEGTTAEDTTVTTEDNAATENDTTTASEATDTDVTTASDTTAEKTGTDKEADGGKDNTTLIIVIIVCTVLIIAAVVIDILTKKKK